MVVSKSVKNIDLHGIKHEDVRTVLVKIIEDYWNQNVDLVIITGHSAAMKEIVIEIIGEYSLEYDVGLNDAYLRVTV